MIKREYRALLVALGLMTRIPVPTTGPVDATTRSHALHWFPAAGLLIGLALAAFNAALPNAALLAATLLVTLWVALTGALHLDGVADCADAWVGGMGDRERSLAILKDPYCGPMGATAIALVLLLKVTALSTLLATPGAPAWWLAPLAARALLLPAFTRLPYLRSGGMGDGFADNASRWGIAMSLVATMGICAIALPLSLALMWLVVAAAVYGLWRRAMLRRLGGFTGDGAGALVELAESGLLVATALCGVCGV